MKRFKSGSQSGGNNERERSPALESQLPQPQPPLPQPDLSAKMARFLATGSEASRSQARLDAFLNGGDVPAAKCGRGGEGETDQQVGGLSSSAGLSCHEVRLQPGGETDSSGVNQAGGRPDLLVELDQAAMSPVRRDNELRPGDLVGGFPGFCGACMRVCGRVAVLAPLTSTMCAGGQRSSEVGGRRCVQSV
jgi:hypothetical protein